MIKKAIIIFLLILILLISVKLVITKYHYNNFEHNRLYLSPVYTDQFIFQQIINFKNLEKLVINYNNQEIKSKYNCNCKLHIKSLKLYEHLKNKEFYNDTWLEANTYKILTAKVPKDNTGTGKSKHFKMFKTININNTPVIERNILIMGNNDYIYKEIDMHGCVTTIIYNLCKIIGIKHDNLYKYFQEKTKIRNDVMKHYNLNYEDTKYFILGYIFNIKTINNIEYLDILVGLKSEISYFKQNIFQYIVKYPKWRTFLENLIQMKYNQTDKLALCDLKTEIVPNLTDSNIINEYLLNDNHCTLFIYLLNAFQNSIMTHIYNYLLNNNYSVDCIIRDACYIRNNKGKNHDWDKLKNDISKNIKNNLKMDIKLQYRNWNEEKIHPLFENKLKCEDLSKKDDKKYLCDMCCRKNN